MSQLFDPIRKKWVAVTPEEKVRQDLLQNMISLGYPKSHIVVEADLKKVYHGPVPFSMANRRLDVAFVDADFSPLLVIECKQGKYRQNAIEQVRGYSALVKSPFFAVADEYRVTTFWVDAKKGVVSFDGLIACCDLLRYTTKAC